MTRRPVLAPGLHVRQRGSAELQVGLTEQHRLRLTDSPGLRRTLAVLARGEAPRSDRETQRALRMLAPVLRDGGTLVHPGVPAGEVAAVSLLHPRTATARLQARRSARVAVLGDLGIDPVPFLERSGLRPCDDPAYGDVVLALATGPLDRQLSDRLHRSHTPHLVVEAIESQIVLGPFVVPGRTACLRCLDAHLSAADPQHQSLVNTAPGTLRNDGVAAPVHAGSAAMALGWAVTDLVRFLEGDRPASWSATVTFTPAQPSIHPTPWPRHPACGCSWPGDPVAPPSQGRSVTLEA